MGFLSYKLIDATCLPAPRGGEKRSSEGVLPGVLSGWGAGECEAGGGFQEGEEVYYFESRSEGEDQSEDKGKS